MIIIIKILKIDMMYLNLNLLFFVEKKFHLLALDPNI